MERIHAIMNHPLYREQYERLEKAEEGRKFCRHQIQHLLDVARIAYIRSLEEGLGFDRELVYAAAVLHDIGKAAQYEERIGHEIAGEAIAAEILDSLPEDLAFPEKDRKSILQAVRGHRKLREDPEVLERLLYEADKASRLCFACPAEKECDWGDHQKNKEILL